LREKHKIIVFHPTGKVGSHFPVKYSLMHEGLISISQPNSKIVEICRDASPSKPDVRQKY